MSFESSKNPLLDANFGDIEHLYATDPVAEKLVADIVHQISQEGEDIPQIMTKVFSDSRLFNALPIAIRENAELFGAYLVNSSRFYEILTNEQRKNFEGETRGLFGPVITLSHGTHANGKPRRTEEGYEINVEYLSSQNIDPTKVLFYRKTQPGTDPKPELYWTSDFYQTQVGLQKEISGDAAESAVTLVCDLSTINNNDGLIQDVNDDSGLAVRQKGIDTFDQKNCLAIIGNINQSS